MNCTRCRALFSAHAEGTLPHGSDLERLIDGHLARCAPCRLEWESFRESLDALHALRPGRATPAETAAVMAAIEQAARDPAATDDLPASVRQLDAYRRALLLGSRAAPPARQRLRWAAALLLAASAGAALEAWLRPAWGAEPDRRHDGDALVSREPAAPELRPPLGPDESGASRERSVAPAGEDESAALPRDVSAVASTTDPEAAAGAGSAPAAGQAADGVQLAGAGGGETGSVPITAPPAVSDAAADAASLAAGPSHAGTTPAPAPWIVIDTAPLVAFAQELAERWTEQVAARSQSAVEAQPDDEQQLADTGREAPRPPAATPAWRVRPGEALVSREGEVVTLSLSASRVESVPDFHVLVPPLLEMLAAPDEQVVVLAESQLESLRAQAEMLPGVGAEVRGLRSEQAPRESGPGWRSLLGLASTPEAPERAEARWQRWWTAASRFLPTTEGGAV